MSSSQCSTSATLSLKSLPTCAANGSDQGGVSRLRNLPDALYTDSSTRSVIPTVSLCFGITSIGTAFVTNKGAICGVRFLLGIFEAGMLPGIAYYLSRWYRRSELAFRLALYVVMAPLAGAFGGLLASAILTLDSFGSLHRWKMIFAIEGIITCCLAVISFFTLTDRPETARWLSQDEKDLAIARVKVCRLFRTLCWRIRLCFVAPFFLANFV